MSIFQKTKLSCNDYEKLANVFWNNPIVNVNSALSAFLGCDNLNMALIPEQWGGILNVDNYHDKINEEQNQQNELIDVYMKYALPDGDLTKTVSNGYQFAEKNEDSPTKIDY